MHYEPVFFNYRFTLSWKFIYPKKANLANPQKCCPKLVVITPNIWRFQVVRWKITVLVNTVHVTSNIWQIQINGPCNTKYLTVPGGSAKDNSFSTFHVRGVILGKYQLQHPNAQTKNATRRLLPRVVRSGIF